MHFICESNLDLAEVVKANSNLRRHHLIVLNSICCRLSYAIALCLSKLLDIVHALCGSCYQRNRLKKLLLRKLLDWSLKDFHITLNQL